MSERAIHSKAAMAPVRPAGELWVWLCGMGLAMGLLMTAGLLLLVFTQGIQVFWPRPLERIELTTPEGGREAVLAAIVQRRDRVSHRIGSEEADLEEWQLLLGNRDLTGRMFRFVDRSEVVATSRPRDAWFAERREGGAALFYPVRLERADGSSSAATEAGFLATVEQVRRAQERRWDEIRQLERVEIGRVSRRLEAKRQAAAAGQVSDPAAAAAERDALQGEFDRLAGQARTLRAQAVADVLIVRGEDGVERRQPVGQIVRLFAPNDLTWWGKVRVFLSRIGEFLSSEPREANTEGGIFPAIFGTFVMTVLMSAAVMPFGVIAAIYLREYAHQGKFVQVVRIAVNNLAGVPSIVFGVFGLGFFVYGLGGTIDELFFAGRPSAVFGTGGLMWASLTLALMTVPVVIVASEEALAAVPRGAREASLACGASKWQTIQRVVLPASAPGILTGLILAMARGAGEVAPLMLVGVVKLAPALPLDTEAPFLHLERKFMHLGFHIYDLGFQSPDSDAAKPMVFATTCLLILLVLLLNLGAILIRNRLRRKYATGVY